MAKHYTKQEIELLKEEAERGATLSELEKLLDRSPKSICCKCQQEYDKNPEEWDEEWYRRLMREYEQIPERSAYRRAYYQRPEVQERRGTSSSAQEVCKAQ